MVDRLNLKAFLESKFGVENDSQKYTISNQLLLWSLQGQWASDTFLKILSRPIGEIFGVIPY